MDKLKFTIALLIHLALAGILYATANNTKPEDTLLTKADYPRQNAFIAFYQVGAEISIDGTVYRLQCTPYKNSLGEWEATEYPTNDFIKVGENGTTTARIEGKYLTFMVE